MKKEAENGVKDNLSQTESLLKTLQSQRHEYNRHLQTLQAMIHLGATQDAIEYLDGISLQIFPQRTWSMLVIHPYRPIEFQR